MNLARHESLTPRDRRLFNAAFMALEDGFRTHSRRTVSLDERIDIAYMMLARVHQELPDVVAQRAGWHLLGGWLRLIPTTRCLAVGLRADDDGALWVLLPFLMIRWQQ